MGISLLPRGASEDALDRAAATEASARIGESGFPVCTDALRKRTAANPPHANVQYPTSVPHDWEIARRVAEPVDSNSGKWRIRTPVLDPSEPMVIARRAAEAALGRALAAAARIKVRVEGPPSHQKVAYLSTHLQHLFGYIFLIPQAWNPRFSWTADVAPS
jgi:hypothetical protein